MHSGAARHEPIAELRPQPDHFADRAHSSAARRARDHPIGKLRFERDADPCAILAWVVEVVVEPDRAAVELLGARVRPALVEQASLIGRRGQALRSAIDVRDRVAAA
jgi:hypothetical protein